MDEKAAHTSPFLTLDFILLVAVVLGALVEYLLLLDLGLPLTTGMRIFTAVLIAGHGK